MPLMLTNNNNIYYIFFIVYTYRENAEKLYSQERMTMLKKAVILLAVAFFLTIFAVPVQADGGPMVVDPDLYARLKESQQIAVITIKDTSTASVDLFVSILDQTGQPNEVTYFVPLGMNPAGFNVRQETSLDFSKLSGPLDAQFFLEYETNYEIMMALFAGALLTNGVWLTPLWLPLLLNGCAVGPAVEPLATFTTDSSQVSVYSLDQTTDIATLVSSTGLNSAVTETLTRLKGQQIAVIKLHTAATVKTSEPRVASKGVPGLHLSWNTALSSSAFGKEYAYPLGTGKAWAHPIELTRVYVTAPRGISVQVEYPKMGTNLSGYTQMDSRNHTERISEAGISTAYAVDKITVRDKYPYPAGTSMWRITYANSNPSDDILVTVRPSKGIDLGLILRFGSKNTIGGLLIPLISGIFVASLLWILVWLLLMPRLIKNEIKLKSLLGFSSIYIGINLGLFLLGWVPMIIFASGYKFIGLFIAVVLFGGPALFFFSKVHINNLWASKGEAIRAFVIVTVVTNVAYLGLVLGYAKLTGIL
jgi:hypothetical protein